MKGSSSRWTRRLVRFLVMAEAFTESAGRSYANLRPMVMDAWRTGILVAVIRFLFHLG